MLQYCWMMGGYLAELATQQEEYAVQQYLPAGNHYWIGLNDQAQEGGQLRTDIIWDKGYNYPPCRPLDLVWQPQCCPVHQLAERRDPLVRRWRAQRRDCGELRVPHRGAGRIPGLERLRLPAALHRGLHQPRPLRDLVWPPHGVCFMLMYCKALWPRNC